MPTVSFFPLGNADCCRIDLAGGQKLLFDYANVRCETDAEDQRIDLPKVLSEDLEETGRSSYDVVAFTHLDRDHICGASKFFYLQHAAKYQSEERVAITELWVPAAVIIEEGCSEEDRIIQAEARYRLRAGKGIRVFSRPAKLEQWLLDQELTLASRQHLITDAGQVIPGFTLQDQGVEFFVHSPFASRLADGTLLDRNLDSLVVHATFTVEGSQTKLILGADTNHEVLSEIVNITKAHNNEFRLEWDMFKLPHHCSYLSLNSEKGKEITSPVAEVEWLFEKQGQSRSTLISTSKPIPLTGDDDQPPHRQAANYYRGVAATSGGRFLVTMEHPRESAPAPLVFTIDQWKASLKMRARAIGSAATSVTAPRVG